MKQEVLRGISFGRQVAEEESENLSSYFVETDQWRRIFSGEVDVVYGAKGSGKSAIYSLLINRQTMLFDRSILAVSAENPRGTPAFSNIIPDPPTTDPEFKGMWKVYLLSLIANQLHEYGFSSPDAQRVIDELARTGVLEEGVSLSGRLRIAIDYVRSMLRIESAEGGVQLDPTSGLPSGVSGKITFREPGAEMRRHGFVSVDDLFRLANTALGQFGYQVWILLDRLDVAFDENIQLEQNALTALFRVYLDLLGLEKISLKIFLRSDIWNRILTSGFREASHITRHVYITWDQESLMNLIIRRIIVFDEIVGFYSINRETVAANTNEQEELFYRIFPVQIEAGPRQSKTLSWMLTHTADGTKVNAPRELIHLLNAARERQLRKLEIGQAEPPEETLFASAAIKEALPEVSKVRLERTLLAEYPQHREWLQKLERAKTQQTLTTLARIWGIPEDQAEVIATELTEIGFFERQWKKGTEIYWVPFLYRDSLQMVQGPA